MHAKKSSMPAYIRVAISLILTGGLLIVGAVLYATGNKHVSHVTNTVQVVTQPLTAAQIAAEENCGQFKDIALSATAPSFGVLDLGTCYVGGVKYAINTFASPTSRDSWLKVSEPFGVNPKWETATSVTYKSVG